MRSLGGTAAVLALALGTAACSGAGEYIWADAVPAAIAVPPRDGYLVAVGDTVNVRVYNQENLSVRTKVRSDGKITMPLLNDVEVAGTEPEVLARRIQVKLKTLVVNPQVTVFIEERSTLMISVLGEVARPGQYPLDPDAGILQALAAAGGLTEYGRRDHIFLVRQGYWADKDRAGNPVRIRFRYGEVAKGVGMGALFRLKSGDVVIVE